MNAVPRIFGLAFAAFTASCQQAPDTYASNCSAPAPGWGGPSDGIGHLRPVLPVSLDVSGSLYWAGRGISDDTLRHYMNEASKLNPQPHLVFEVAAEAPCDRVRAVRRIISSAPLCKKAGLCSEGADWKKWPIVGGP